MAGRDPSPPPFLALAGHPVRWRLLTELSHGDRRVRELCARTDRRQSLVSYHLRRLRQGGLVAARASDADGRDTYYTLDLPGCRALIAATAGALHPGLAGSAPHAARTTDQDAAPARVLFLC